MSSLIKLVSDIEEKDLFPDVINPFNPVDIDITIVIEIITFIHDPTSSPKTDTTTEETLNGLSAFMSPEPYSPNASIV